MDDTVREISNKLASQYMPKIPQGKINKTNDFIFLENIISAASRLILHRNNACYKQLAQELNDPKTSSKTFYNDKEVYLFSPLSINHKIEPDLILKANANFFDKFFFCKCTSIQNNSFILNFIECELISILTSIIFNDGIILKIIKALDVNKAHDHDYLSIRMIILYGKSIISALSLIENN